MQLVFHAGAHFCEEARVMKCLLRNSAALRAQNTAVPDPKLYRPQLRQRLTSMDNYPPGEFGRDTVLTSMLGEGETADRVVLSNAHLFGAPRAALRRGLFYPNGAERMAYLKRLFYPCELELFLAIRDPATFLPACLAESPRATMHDFTSGMDPSTLRWSDTLMSLRDAAPDLKITVWCNEDAPLIWGQIMRAMSRVDFSHPVLGEFDLLAEIMSRDGYDRFEQFLKDKPKLTEGQLGRVVTAFAEKYALEHAIDQVVDVPGWTENVIANISDNYDEDVERIATIPGVRLIVP